MGITLYNSSITILLITSNSLKDINFFIKATFIEKEIYNNLINLKLLLNIV